MAVLGGTVPAAASRLPGAPDGADLARRERMSVRRRLSFELHLLLAAALLALGLVLLVLATGLGTIRGEAAFPPEGRFLVVDGVRLHYVDDGPAGAPAVALIHGNPGFLTDFDAARAALRRAGYRVLAFDRPGHGYSARPHPGRVTPEVQARLLHDLLARLGIARPVLVGHSWGTTLALVYALRYPGDVAGLVLAGAVGYPYSEPFSALLSIFHVPVTGWFIRNTLALPLGRMVAGPLAERDCAPAPAPPRALAIARALAPRPGDLEADGWDVVLAQRTLRSDQTRWSRIRAPVVELQGVGDDVTRDALRLARQIPGARLFWVPDAGHELPETAPGWIVAGVDSVEALGRK